jgi:predicted regulator of Ras-like GTPase activity (Roadblock/LC7/MglB family)
VSIQGHEGTLYLYAAGARAVLTVSSPFGGNAGLIHLEARAVAKEIGELL